MSEPVPENIEPVQVETPYTGPLHVETTYTWPVQVETPYIEPVQVPDVIDLNNLINEHQVLAQRESDLKSFFNDTLISVPVSTFKPKLIKWATLRFPIMYPIWSVDLVIPDVCCDGVTRGLVAYIEHSIGITVNELIATLQAKFIDINVTYSYQNNRFSIVVLKV